MFFSIAITIIDLRCFSKVDYLITYATDRCCNFSQGFIGMNLQGKKKEMASSIAFVFTPNILGNKKILTVKNTSKTAKLLGLLVSILTFDTIDKVIHISMTGSNIFFDFHSICFNC